MLQCINFIQDESLRLWLDSCCSKNVKTLFGQVVLAYLFIYDEYI